jgi:hypothetical protein
MHKTHTINLKLLYNKNMSFSIEVHVHVMNLMKIQIVQKCQSFEILKERASI